MVAEVVDPGCPHLKTVAAAAAQTCMTCIYVRSLMLLVPLQKYTESEIHGLYTCMVQN